MTNTRNRWNDLQEQNNQPPRDVRVPQAVCSGDSPERLRTGLTRLPVSRISTATSEVPAEGSRTEAQDESPEDEQLPTAFWDQVGRYPNELSGPRMLSPLRKSAGKNSKSKPQEGMGYCD